MQACVALSADHFLTIEPDRQCQLVSIQLFRLLRDDSMLHINMQWNLCVSDFSSVETSQGSLQSWLLIGCKALSCQYGQGRFNDTTAQAQHQVQGGLLVRMTKAHEGSSQWQVITIYRNYRPLYRSYIYIHISVCAWYIYTTYTCIYDICSRELKHVLKILYFHLGWSWLEGSWELNACPFGCCSHSACVHPPTASPRRSSVADLVGCLVSVEGRVSLNGASRCKATSWCSIQLHHWIPKNHIYDLDCFRYMLPKLFARWKAPSLSWILALTLSMVSEASTSSIESMARTCTNMQEPGVFSSVHSWIVEERSSYWNEWTQHGTDEVKGWRQRVTHKCLCIKTQLGLDIITYLPVPLSSAVPGAQLFEIATYIGIKHAHVPWPTPPGFFNSNSRQSRIQGDGLPSQGLHENLHGWKPSCRPRDPGPFEPSTFPEAQRLDPNWTRSRETLACYYRISPDWNLCVAQDICAY